MHPKGLIHQVLITLEVGDSTVLYILLTRDGVIQRKGDGNPSHGALPLYQGTSNDGHFEALMMTVAEDIFHYTGVHRLANPVGTECRLTIIFQGNNDLDYSFRVVYGLDSEGPPVELAGILINAVKITEPWYQAQVAENKAPEKKWWQVWK